MLVVIVIISHIASFFLCISSFELHKHAGAHIVNCAQFHCMQRQATVLQGWREGLGWSCSWDFLLFCPLTVGVGGWDLNCSAWHERWPRSQQRRHISLDVDRKCWWELKVSKFIYPALFSNEVYLTAVHQDSSSVCQQGPHDFYAVARLLIYYSCCLKSFTLIIKLT